MKKVFRLHSDGATNSDWFSSQAPSNNVIGQIREDDTKTDELPSSIPSPFARMDLVRTAFRHVNNQGLDGETYHHKLVSEALDIGEILFNYETHSERLQLVTWNKGQRLGELGSSSHLDHRQLGKTLELFFKQDEHFNFKDVSDIYILKYDDKVIGGTSPLTLFFASPFNDRKSVESRLTVDIQFGSKTVFSDTYKPLCQRDTNYFQYLYSLSKIRGFAASFPDLFEYIERCSNKLQNTNHEFYSTLINSSPTSYLHSLQPLHVPGVAGHVVHPLINFPIYKAVSDPSKIQSDFFIDSEHKISFDSHQVSPLVLPVDRFNHPLRYTSAKWDPLKSAPTFDPNPVERRKLPHTNEKYPYLTMDDFLEKSIIRLSTVIDENNFSSPSQRFLIPLTDTFFEYFSSREVISKKLIEITENTKSVSVKLKIPISGNKDVQHIQYERIFKKPSTVTLIGGISGIGPNEGIIYDLDFGVAVTPGIRDASRHIDYTIGLVNQKNDTPVELSFFMDGQQSVSSYTNKRFSVGRLDISSEYYVVPEAFNLIKVRSGKGIAGYLIPKFAENASGNSEYSFAVDFGTSNTHIEYTSSELNDTQPFSLNREESHILYSFQEGNGSAQGGETEKAAELIKDLFKQELFPQNLNEGSSEYVLPMRTAILQNKEVDFQGPTYLFNHYNIAFDFEKAQIKQHLIPKTNIKWSNYNDSSNRKQLEHYVENILVLIRNKVLLKGGSLDKTKIVWFYPSSMGENKVHSLRQVWNDKATALLGEQVARNIRNLPESIAPFYYYNKKLTIHALTKPVVSIDIGGGTADVVVFKENKPQLLTSFRFAGKAIFGDGFGGSMQTNGFITKYLSYYKSKLNSDDLVTRNLSAVLSQLESKGFSEDIVNFFFSLINNKQLRAKKIELDFAKELAGESATKVVFLLYYTSLFYHVNKLLLDKGIDRPHSLLLSGTGAKTAFIVDQSGESLDNLALLFGTIYAHLSGSDGTTTTRIIVEKSPKEITAKGGLYSDNTDPSELDKIITILLGADSKLYPSFNPHNHSDQKGKKFYKDVIGNDELFEGVVDEVVSFLKLFLKMSESLNFHRKFGVSQHSIELVKDLLSEARRHELIDDIKNGVNEKLKELESAENSAVDETLFFYPLIGAINRVARQSISQSQ